MGKNNNSECCMQDEHGARIHKALTIYTLVIASTAMATAIVALSFGISAKRQAEYAASNASYLLEKKAEEESAKNVVLDSEKRNLLNSYADLTNVTEIQVSQSSAYIIAKAVDNTDTIRYFYKGTDKWQETALLRNCESNSKDILEIFAGFKSKSGELIATCTSLDGAEYGYSEAVRKGLYK